MTTFITGQRKNHETLQRIMTGARLQIDALDPDLQPKVLEQRAGAIRDKAITELNRVHQRMREACDDAKKKLPFLTQEAARTKALEAMDPAANTALFNALSRTSRQELVNRMRAAVAEGNEAKAEAIRLEFSSRPTAPRDPALGPEPLTVEMGTLVGNMLNPAYATREREQQAVVAVYDLAAHQFNEFTGGRQDAIGRLTAVRALKAAEALLEDPARSTFSARPVSLIDLDNAGMSPSDSVERVGAAMESANAIARMDSARAFNAAIPTEPQAAE